MKIISIILSMLVVILSGCGTSDGPSLLSNITPGSTPASNNITPIVFFDGQSSDVVIGQSVFTTNASGTTSTALNYPWGNPSIYDGTLFVTDYYNNRVLGYNSIPTTSGVAADFVIGQANLTSGIANNGGIGAATLSHPSEALIAGGKLFVSDATNNRVLIWNSVPASNGVAADVVVGQPNMTTSTANTGGISASTLNYPADVWSDGTKLIVADSKNHRMLVWNQVPTANNQPADLVLGQTNFTSNTPNEGGSISASGFDSSASAWSSVTSNGLQIFYSDYGNNRILIWNTFPTTNGQAADVVLGQANFTTNTAPNPPTAASLNGVGGITYSGTQFFITDYNNSRVLICLD